MASIALGGACPPACLAVAAMLPTLLMFQKFVNILNHTLAWGDGL
jgi:hypothetical protein